MKIALNLNQESTATIGAVQDKELEQLILMTRSGDWAAKERLAKMFLPVIQDMASKRSDSGIDHALLVDAGRRGVVKAAKKSGPSQGAHGFRISVVEHIERAVDRAAKGSILSKLFGG
jgi:DNA-directed RNA polymerase specialized sigma subunit